MSNAESAPYLTSKTDQVYQSKIDRIPDSWEFTSVSGGCAPFKVVDLQATRTEQLLDELYRDRDRLDCVLGDAVDVIGTLLLVIDRTRTGEAQDEFGDLSDAEYTQWAFALGQQFIGTHGDEQCQ
jgi:hypothetical protein